MTTKRITRLAALGTLAIASAIVLARDLPGQNTIALGPVETISGVPFPETPEGVRVTEPLAHIRVPFSRTNVGKTLDLEITMSAIDADVVEVGVRRGSFWLDYERMPVRHRILDRLAAEDSGWTIRQHGAETVFFPSSAPVAASSVEAFLASPPSTGTIGLYGNTTLPCGAPQQNDRNLPEKNRANISSKLADGGAKAGAAQNTCTVAPFRVTDDPSTFSAIYARYVPRQGDAVTKRVSVPLTTMFQNPDGSFDVMFFLQNRNGGDTSMTLQNIHADIRAAWPSLGELRTRTRRLLTDFRASVQGAERP